MIRSRSILILLLSLIIFSSCITDQKKFNGQIITEFPTPIELKGDRVFEDELGLISIKVIDSLTVISTMKKDIIKVYDSNQHLISGFGKKGRGPNEFNMSPVIQDGIKTRNFIRIFTLDQQLLTLSSIDIKTSIDSSKVSINKRYELPRELSGTIDIFYVDSTEIIGTYDDRFSKRLNKKRGGFYYHPRTDNFNTFPLFNLTIKPYEVMPATNINARSSDISPNRSKFASVMMHYPGLEIFDLNSDINDNPKRYMLDSDPPSVVYDLNTFKEDGYLAYYLDVEASDNYIYLLYLGNKLDDRAHQTYIKVLNWKGKPHKQYLIPSKYNLSMISVDEKNQYFYGLSYSNDAIYKFEYNSNE